MASGYKLRPAEQLYIPLEDFDLSFAPSEVASVIDSWRRGDSLPHIAARLRRDQVEIAVLVMDLAVQGRIERRPGGVWGRGY